MGHGHKRDAEMTIGVHGKPETESPADLTQMLYLLQAAPVMWIAQDNLYRVLLYRFGNISKRGYGHIAGQRRFDTCLQQAMAHLGHAVDAGGGVFEISAVS